VARAADAENIVAADSTNERKHNDRVVTDAIVSTSCMAAIDADVIVLKCIACDHDAVMNSG